MKKSVIEYVNKQIGVCFDLCLDLPEIKNFNGVDYFNIKLNQSVSESLEYKLLERLSKKSSVIHHIEPNGLKRVAIFVN